MTAPRAFKTLRQLRRQSLDTIRRATGDAPVIVGDEAPNWVFRDAATGLVIFTTGRYQVAMAFAAGYMAAWRGREEGTT